MGEGQGEALLMA